MADLPHHTYVFDTRDKLNRFIIQRVKPGQEIRILVRPEDDIGKPITAKGTRSEDGKSFSIVVTKNDGQQQTHIVNYKALLMLVSAAHPGPEVE